MENRAGQCQLLSKRSTNLSSYANKAKKKMLRLRAAPVRQREEQSQWRESRRGKKCVLFPSTKQIRLTWLRNVMKESAEVPMKLTWSKIPLDEVAKKRRNRLAEMSGWLLTDIPSTDQIIQEYFRHHAPDKKSQLDRMQHRETERMHKMYEWLADINKSTPVPAESVEYTKIKSREAVKPKRRPKTSSIGLDEDEFPKWSESDKSWDICPFLTVGEEDKQMRNLFVRDTLEELGSCLQDYREANGESEQSRKMRHLAPPKAITVEEAREFFTKGLYHGQWSPLGIEGHGIYILPHGPIYMGHLIDGRFEGHGILKYPNGGILRGFWVNGVLYDPKYKFADGLYFDVYDWRYCRMPDRRFFSEIQYGLKAPGNEQLTNDIPSRAIPEGCLDSGEGFYDPKKKYLYHLVTGKIIRIVSEEEGKWIEEYCRKAWKEDVPFSKYVYENWFPGTEFQSSDHDPKWYPYEFPTIKIPYQDINDVCMARRAVIKDAIEQLSRPPPDVEYPLKKDNRLMELPLVD